MTKRLEIYLLDINKLIVFHRTSLGKKTSFNVLNNVWVDVLSIINIQMAIAKVLFSTKLKGETRGGGVVLPHNEQLLEMFKNSLVSVNTCQVFALKTAGSWEFPHKWVP